MNSSNQITDNTTLPLRLLIVGGTDKVITQCEPLLRSIDAAFSLEKSTTRATLTRALSNQRWDLILICPPLKTLDTTQVMALMAEHKIDATPLMLSEALADEVALRGLRDGAYNTLSLQHHEHFQMILRREIKELENRRQLSKLQTEKKSSNTQTTSPDGNKKDLLTNLYTQQYFTSGLVEIFKKTPPDSHIQHGMLMINLDEIDTIRQQVGVAAADIIIAEIAGCVRDYIPTYYPIARFDDHRFSVLIQKTTLNKIESIANTMCKKVADYTINVSGSEIPKVTCSIGIALTDNDTYAAPHLIKMAQTASEAASAAGGNQSHLFDPQCEEQYGVVIEQPMERQIRQALKEDRFTLLYLPIVSLKSNTAENYELLLRMLDDNNEVILPGDFMPIASQMGLMPSIDRWVTHNALTELSNRRRDGKDTSFFVKLDHATLSDDDFHPWLGKQLRENKVPGDVLVFEISERSDLKAPTEVTRFMQQLKTLHCRCALDHFGDNEASLKRLERLPLDFIKIDRSLIQRINTDPKIQEKVKLLVKSAHDKEQKGIAEFVQDARTLSALWSCGMDYIQGYFLQPPDDTMYYDFTDEN